MSINNWSIPIHAPYSVHAVEISTLYHTINCQIFDNIIGDMTLFTSSATLHVHETSTKVTGNLNHNVHHLYNHIIANAETPNSANQSNLIYWPGNHVFALIINISTCTIIITIVMIFSAVVIVSTLVGGIVLISAVCCCIVFMLRVYKSKSRTSSGTSGSLALLSCLYQVVNFSCVFLVPVAIEQFDMVKNEIYETKADMRMTRNSAYSHPNHFFREP